MQFHFTNKQLSDFAANIRKEWAMTNGIGGYAGGSVIGACNRTHQGYLIASLHPPVERYMVLSKTNECVTQDGVVCNLETAQHAGAPIGATVVDSSEVPAEYLRQDTVSVASDFTVREPVYTQGQQYLTDFIYDGNVTFVYQANQLAIRKTLSLVRNENTVAIGYEIHNTGSAAEFSVTPLFNFREHSASSTVDDLKFTLDNATASGFTLCPESNPDLHIVVSFSEGTLVPRDKLFDVDMQYQTEVDNEVPGLDSHYTPYDIVFNVPAGSTMHISIICTVTCGDTPSSYSNVDSKLAHKLAEERLVYFNHLIEQSGYAADEFAEALVVASDQFLAHRSSTGLKTVLAGLPWFTDWGRDTMIAFSGLTLVTKRFAEAREILITFAKYIHNGLVPNMFPDDGQEPLYNTVDASLWYFFAVDQYLRYTNAASDYEFIHKEIYPALCEIIASYKKGTDFSIYMDEDGLIHAGSGVDQVTWMDVRVGDWVVTPRHGKPVEINALWYNALMVMAELSERFGDTPASYLTLAEQVKSSFCSKFWNEDKKCLYDVIDDTECDDSVRPNQIYAVSLPHTMLSKEQALAVVDIVQKELYAGPGIRSLSPKHKDYHPIYCGSLPKRDAAYHQGTAWGYIMGGFISAYMKVHDHSEEARKQALAFLEPVRLHLLEGCIGSISEIFDGDSPHNGRGCYAQAWSVGEVLRCYTEDILGK